ncbi:unnamed protein product, partial [Rotaria sp. Silwood2]
MVDEINQSIDVVVPCIDENKVNDNGENKLMNLSENKINGRPLYQIRRKKYIEIIRRQLQAKNRILLTTYNTYAYYSCERTEMQEKILEHMIRTGAYRFNVELNVTDQHYIEIILNSIDHHITDKLNNLCHDKLISYSQWEKLNANRSTNRLDTLYFLPDTRRENIPFYPMIQTHHRLTINLSRFLIRLLQPIYDHVTFSKTFNTGVDVINALEEYNKKGLLRSNTLFVALHIHDLSTLIPHDHMYTTLQRFLCQYLFDREIEGLTLPTILDLVRLVVENQYILYENKFYQQIQGGACNAPLTMLLTNIFIYYWQQELMATLNVQNEIFGRCFDEIFFTWNESQERLHDLLHTMNRYQPEIQITLVANDHINYLDLHIQQHKGDLKIQVAHDLNIEPYSLPYVFGHPRNRYQTLLRAALLRATRCCTNVVDFANELQHIQLSFQYNRFTNDFIIDKIQLYFEEFSTPTLKIHCGEQYYDQSL